MLHVEIDNICAKFSEYHAVAVVRIDLGARARVRRDDLERGNARAIVSGKEHAVVAPAAVGAAALELYAVLCGGKGAHWRGHVALRAVFGGKLQLARGAGVLEPHAQHVLGGAVREALAAAASNIGHRLRRCAQSNLRSCGDRCAPPMAGGRVCLGAATAPTTPLRGARRWPTAYI